MCCSGLGFGCVLVGGMCCSELGFGCVLVGGVCCSGLGFGGVGWCWGGGGCMCVG